MQVNLAFVDFYAVLSLPRDAPSLEVKQAYHRILLKAHPDKRKSEDDTLPPLDAGLLQQAYLTLSDPASRKVYDVSLAASETRLVSGPRPAQVVSLEEFVIEVDDVGLEHWKYTCRCGGIYHIDDRLMEEDQHLIGCDSCSEVVWVGYEVENNDFNGNQS